MFSGVHILMKGKSEFWAIWAARAVLPELGGPEIYEIYKKWTTQTEISKQFKHILPEKKFAVMIFQLSLKLLKPQKWWIDNS